MKGINWRPLLHQWLRMRDKFEEIQFRLKHKWECISTNSKSQHRRSKIQVKVYSMDIFLLSYLFYKLF